MLSDTSKSSTEDLGEAFEQALDHVLVAGQQFVNGDPTSIKELWSHTDDVSIFGGGGGQGRGWEQVGPSLDGGATLFRSGQGHVDVDIIAKGRSGDLAYTIGIEHGEALMRGQEELRPLA